MREDGKLRKATREKEENTKEEKIVKAPKG